MQLLRWLKSASTAALAITAIAACSENSVEPLPDHIDALYVATSVGGQALPRTESFVDSRMTLIADTLRLFANGDVRRTTVFETVDEGIPSHSVVQKADFNGRYLIDGVQLKVAPPCGEAALCGPGPVIGTIGPARVTLATSQLGENSGKLVFKRIE
ncbi:MAG TPA: hypothetical protein VF042_16655 [Gemmatimonadaceae bacterium]